MLAEDLDPDLAEALAPGLVVEDPGVADPDRDADLDEVLRLEASLEHDRDDVHQGAVELRHQRIGAHLGARWPIADLLVLVEVDGAGTLEDLEAGRDQHRLRVALVAPAGQVDKLDTLLAHVV